MVRGLFERHGTFLSALGFYHVNFNVFNKQGETLILFFSNGSPIASVGRLRALGCCYGLSLKKAVCPACCISCSMLLPELKGMKKVTQIMF